MEIKIVATTGRAQGQAVEIKAAKFFIGRHDNCQIRPDIAGLAGIHALIEMRERRFYLRDFGAEGGTGLNDRVLHARETEVFDGDLIQVGPMVLTLSIKPKGEDLRETLIHAPAGWPYLEGLDDDAFAPATPRVTSFVPPPHTPPTFLVPPTLEPSLKPRPAVRLEPAVAESSASTATAVASPPAPTRPIITRPVGRRAIATEVIDEVMVVKILPADLNEEETVSPVRYELRSLLEEDHATSRMVVDMGNTRFLSSRAVGVLLAHYQGLERKGATMRVSGVSKEIKPVLDQMRLSMLIDIYPTVEEAVQTPWD